MAAGGTNKVLPSAWWLYIDGWQFTMDPGKCQLLASASGATLDGTRRKQCQHRLLAPAPPAACLAAAMAAGFAAAACLAAGLATAACLPARLAAAAMLPPCQGMTPALGRPRRSGVHCAPLQRRCLLVQQRLQPPCPRAAAPAATSLKLPVSAGPAAAAAATATASSDACRVLPLLLPTASPYSPTLCSRSGKGGAADVAFFPEAESSACLHSSAGLHSQVA